MEIEQGHITGGFAHNQVMQLADKVVQEAVKSGAIKKFVVMAGGMAVSGPRILY